MVTEYSLSHKNVTFALMMKAVCRPLQQCDTMNHNNPTHFEQTWLVIEGETLRMSPIFSNFCHNMMPSDLFAPVLKPSRPFSQSAFLKIFGHSTIGFQQLFLVMFQKTETKMMLQGTNFNDYVALKSYVM